ncbi:MAG: hypothetical protein A4S09_00645 [Proteobacteria bacterium SG_bin7]|nr:MAG: hypothetical protein A4S09_00645 [Proteobacteria bacterium SG_bin7]
MKPNKLNEQLKSFLEAAGIDPRELPKDKNSWFLFLEAISSHIHVIESDREMLSHSLEASTAAVHETSDLSQKLENEILQGEAELRAFIASTPLGLFLSDATGSINYMNEHFCKIMGYTTEDNLRKDWLDLIHPDDRADFLIKWHQLQHNPTMTIHGDIRFCGINSKTNEKFETWCHVNMTTINIRGVVKGYLGTVDDVHERKRAESLLEGEKQILEMMVRNSGQKVILESILQLIQNQSFEMNACVGQFTNQGRSVVHLASINLPDSFANVFGKLNVDQKKFEASFKNPPKNGEKQIYNLSRDPNWSTLCKLSINLGFADQYALPIIDSHGNTSGIFIFFTKINVNPTLEQLEIFEFFNDLFSITIEKTSLEEKLLQEQMKLISNSKMASLGEMAGSIAHEIINPIAIVDGFAVRLTRMITSGKINMEELKAGIDKIRSTVDRITKIVTSLRNFARDGDNDSFAEAKVTDIINDTLEFSRQKIGYRKIELRVDDIDPTLKVDCRPIQISQVLLNLLSNAADAVEALNKRWIQIQAKEIGDKVQIRVIDSGPGIRQEFLDKIMKPYFTTKPLGKGTGLGLSLSRSIIETHRGTLFVDRDSENTCFVIELPKRQIISTVKAA